MICIATEQIFIGKKYFKLVSEVYFQSCYDIHASAEYVPCLVSAAVLSL